MVNVRVIMGERFYFNLVFYILGAFFNKTIILLALVGYEMISQLPPRWLSTISNSTRARGIIVK